jgi:hypothetical protein
MNMVSAATIANAKPARRFFFKNGLPVFMGIAPF